jgi:hypothetical protein
MNVEINYNSRNKHTNYINKNDKEKKVSKIIEKIIYLYLFFYFYHSISN